MSKNNEWLLDLFDWSLEGARMWYDPRANAVAVLIPYFAASLEPSKAEEFIGDTPLWREIQSCMQLPNHDGTITGWSDKVVGETIARRITSGLKMLQEEVDDEQE